MPGLILTHTRFQLLETSRTPIAIIGSAIWPAASMLAFVVPYARDDPHLANVTTASMLTFAVMSTNLFQYGVGVADDRVQPWDPYVRTLAAGAMPRFAGRLLAGLALMAVALLPVVLISAFLTAASLSPAWFLLAALTVALISVPFILMGLAIGYSMPPKAAVVVAQVLFLPLAFGGGLMSAPGWAPGIVETVGPYLPTGGAVRLMWAAVGEAPFRPVSVVSLVTWTAALAGVAWWAYRRDEGRRFS
jgi:ABC-2 type transport system permease protein